MEIRSVEDIRTMMTIIEMVDTLQTFSEGRWNEAKRQLCEMAEQRTPAYQRFIRKLFEKSAKLRQQAE